MNLTLDRYEADHAAEATFGRLLWVRPTGLPAALCETLEDRVRHPIPWNPVTAPVAAWKVQNRTAIPPGTYRVVITPSARFKTDLPLVEHVPGFTGIRIHAGNVIEDTDGCILVGLDRSVRGTKTAWLGRSRAALQFVMSHLRSEPGPHWLTIIESYTAPVA